MGESSDRKRAAEPTIQAIAKRARHEDSPIEDEIERPKFIKPEASRVLPRAPFGWTVFQEDGRILFRNDLTNKVQGFTPSTSQVESRYTAPIPKPSPIVPLDVNAIIAEAQAVAEAAEAVAELARTEAAVAQTTADEERRKEFKSSSAKNLKEKKVMGLFGAVVVKVMSKYRSELDADQFKKRAKEVSIFLFSILTSH